MRRSKRKIESKYGSRTGQSEPRTKKNLRNTLLTLPSKIGEDESVLQNLLYACILRMIPHVWVKILPSSPEDVNNLAFVIGQKWEILQLLLLRLKYLKKYKNEVRMNILKFEELEHVDINGAHVRIGSSQLGVKNKKKIYYLCYDKPAFLYPCQQISQNVSYTILPYSTRTDNILKNMLVKYLCCDELLLEEDEDNTNEGLKTLSESIELTEHNEAVTPANANESNLHNNHIQNQIISALALDLTKHPRIHRTIDNAIIETNKRKQATSTEKLLLLINAWRWGYNEQDCTYLARSRILRASSRLVAYDNGYQKEFSVATIRRWETLAIDQITVGTRSMEVAQSRHKGSISSTDLIEVKYPGYLHQLFRQALYTKGSNSSFSEIACHMNLASRKDSEVRDHVELNRNQIEVWFKKQHGKLISPVEKPLDTPEHCLKRIDWVIENYGLLTNPYTPVCFIDEKWFYRVNRRRAMKVLPKNDCENGNVLEVKKSKMLSRRFPIKTMFMGVVGRPIPHRRFNGKIFMERVSKTKYVTSATSHTNFSDDALVNDAIKMGGWKDLVDSTVSTTEDLLEFIRESYNIEDSTVDHIEFFYITKIGNNGNTKKVMLEDDGSAYSSKMIRYHDNKEILPRPVILSDINLHVRNVVGDPVQVDCTCDSEYMKDAMVRVGTAIRAAYSWIPISEPCWLVMDNAGGHGTKECIIEYRTVLLTDYNIIILFQIPRSPYTNVLDLGVWMSLQSIVERKHYLKRSTTQALTNTVMDTWQSTDLDTMLTNVFCRLKVVLCNILRGNGGNDKVEEYRGVKHRDIKIENVIKEIQTENDNTQNDVPFDYNEVNIAPNEEYIQFENEDI